MGRRVAIIGAAVLAGWLVLLFVLGVALGDRQAQSTREQLAESLHATVTIGDSELSLVRGRWSMDRLALRRADSLGTLALDVAGVRCELAPLGWALVDRSCGELAVRGVRMDVSSTALFRGQRPKREPVRADRVVIDDAALVFEPSALVPSLGRIAITIEHAESGPTRMQTPLSWLLALETLRAQLSLPAGITLHLTYEHGVLTAAGSLFGARPVAIPLELPARQRARDAHEEMQQLVALGKDIAGRLVARRAQDWLESKLSR